MAKRVIKKNGITMEVIDNPNFKKKAKKLTMDQAQDLSLSLLTDLEEVTKVAFMLCQKHQASKAETSTIVLNALSMAAGRAIMNIYPKEDHKTVVETYCKHLKAQMAK